tara:strand:+ start:301 stop:459 length:159 start_codon:yes stop_codon:yes gene_type:complete
MRQDVSTMSAKMAATYAAHYRLAHHRDAYHSLEGLAVWLVQKEKRVNLHVWG